MYYLLWYTHDTPNFNNPAPYKLWQMEKNVELEELTKIVKNSKSLKRALNNQNDEFI